MMTKSKIYNAVMEALKNTVTEDVPIGTVCAMLLTVEHDLASMARGLDFSMIKDQIKEIKTP